MPMCMCIYTAPFSTHISLLKDQNTLKFLWNKFFVNILKYYKYEDHLIIAFLTEFYVYTELVLFDQ